MTRRVFFSFHYESDIWRACQVRNSWLTKGDSAGYVDAAAWEAVKRGGDRAIQNWIDRELRGTSVTAVLVGRDTAKSKWVRYEIERSIADGKGLLAIFIHNVKDQAQNVGQYGPNPLDEHRAYGPFESYDWVLHHGYQNLATWVEAAAAQAGR